MINWITATAIYQYVCSPFAVWCDAHAPHDAKDPVNEFQELLWRSGREHEHRILAARYPDVAPIEAPSKEDAFALVISQMEQGIDVLVQPPLLLPAERMGGRVDILVRDDRAPSRFGNYHYRVQEIKRARNLRDEHRLQGAFYNHILGKIQGHLPRTFTLIDADGNETIYDHSEDEIRTTLAAIQAIRAGKPVPAIYGEGIWPWGSYTDATAIEADDVSLIGGVGPALRGSLAAAGLATVGALAEAKEEALQKVRGVGKVRSRSLPIVAQALRTGKHIRTGTVDLPQTDIEVFLDLEGTSDIMADEDIEPIDYLIGCLERRGGEERYFAFVAHTLDDEATMLRSFIEWLSERPTCVLYHWHHYEATHLRKMAERHGLWTEWKRLIKPRLRDLFKDATKAFAFPTYGLGLKKIAPYMGFAWRHKEVNALQSIAYYFEYVRDPVANADKLQKVCDYNEDDCRATRVVKDWLLAQPDRRD